MNLDLLTIFLNTIFFNKRDADMITISFKWHLYACYQYSYTLIHCNDDILAKPVTLHKDQRLIP